MDLEANFGRAYFEQRRDRNRQLAARSATPGEGSVFEVVVPL